MSYCSVAHMLLDLCYLNVAMYLRGVGCRANISPSVQKRYLFLERSPPIIGPAFVRTPNLNTLRMSSKIERTLLWIEEKLSALFCCVLYLL
jgi:hypothetical protein